MFTTLVYHEIRPQAEIASGMRPILVRDGYNDQLPLALYNGVDCFEVQMKYLKENGYTFLTMAEVKAFYQEHTTLPEKSLLLTFDDCYQSLKKYAYPILHELKIPATVFTVTGWLFEQPSPYEADVSKVLSLPELEEMRDIFEYANHTNHFHQRHGVTESMSMWEPQQKFAEDLAECNAYEVIDYHDVFAYPFGLYAEKNVQTLAENNFVLSFTCEPGANLATTPPLELHRDVIPNNMPMPIYIQKVEGSLE